MAKILILDDEPELIELMEIMLTMIGDHTVVSATNGRDGMSLLEKEAVDILITDMNMPQQNGLDTIVEVKRLYPNLKVIAFSGDGDLLSEARNSGCDGQLQKPFSKEDLLAEISRLA